MRDAVSECYRDAVETTAAAAAAAEAEKTIN